MTGLLSKCIFIYALTTVFFIPLTCKGQTTDEQHAVEICRQLSKGIVNITSTAITHDSYLEPLPHKGTGSGFILDYQGHILTNYHVISDKHSIEVTLYDGHRWPARIVGIDSETDLAILELRAPQQRLESLSPMQLAATKPNIGQTVFALSNPFGTGYMVSRGIISSVGRSILRPDGCIVHNVIQTDVSVGLGISGGPLVDLSGRVIGINTLIFNSSRYLPGAGFAISYETIEWVASQIISRGCVARAWLGAKLQNVTPALADFLNLPVDKGAIIVSVTPNGPADQAGLRGSEENLRIGNVVYPVGGDIIVKIGDQEVKSDTEVIRILLNKKPEDRVLISVYSGECLKRLWVHLGNKPSNL